MFECMGNRDRVDLLEKHNSLITSALWALQGVMKRGQSFKWQDYRSEAAEMVIYWLKKDGNLDMHARTHSKINAFNDTGF